MTTLIHTHTHTHYLPFFLSAPPYFSHAFSLSPCHIVQAWTYTVTADELFVSLAVCDVWAQKQNGGSTLLLTGKYAGFFPSLSLVCFFKCNFTCLCTVCILWVFFFRLGTWGRFKEFKIPWQVRWCLQLPPLSLSFTLQCQFWWPWPTFRATVN